MREFNFKHRDNSNTVYTAHYAYGDPVPEDVVIVTWNNQKGAHIASDFTTYSEKEADKLFDNGTWIKC